MLQKIADFGIKKIVLYIHYALAILTSLAMFVFTFIGTLSPNFIDAVSLFSLYLYILVYCIIVIVIVTLICIFEKTQETAHKKLSLGQKVKFDIFAFFIGFCMFMTFGLMCVCCIHMFLHPLTEVEKQMYTYMISVFAGMFGTEGFLGLINNFFKKRFNKVEEPPIPVNNNVEQTTES